MAITARLGTTLLVVGGVVAIVGSLRPWVASGSKQRHSYDIVELVERLGFARDGLVDLGLRAWPLVPLLLVGAVAAAWWGRRWLAATIGVVAAVYAGGMGVAVWQAPHVSVVRPLNGGTLTTVAGAVIVLAGSVCCGWSGANARRA